MIYKLCNKLGLDLSWEHNYVLTNLLEIALNWNLQQMKLH